MTNKHWLITIAIFIIAFTLRFYHYEENAPFDWDQNRDYGEVIKIASGKFVTLGPVAKGSGGFYLGSLYYYVLYPAYYLMNGSLSSLPLTSIVIDVIAAGLIFLLLYKTIGKKKALFMSLIWTFSWFVIGMSRISWNVALVPLWSILTIYCLVQIIVNHSVKHFYLMGLLVGLSVHVHVAAIPVIPLLVLIFIRSFKFTFKEWLVMIGFGILPVLPLIAFDLKHGLQNAHLLRDQIGYQAVVKTPLIPMIQMTFIKLGKVVSGMMISKFADNFILGILTVALAFKSYFFDRRIIMRIAGANILISALLIVAFHDYGFPEYYFAPAYIAILLVIVSSVVDALKSLGSLGNIAQYGAIILILILNINSYSYEKSGFSLSVKNEIVESLKSIEGPVDMSYNFDPGRDGGLRYLVKQKGIILDPKSKNRILLTDKLNVPLYIDGELARELTQIGNIKSALYIVQ